jgi:hypothetical protein
LRIVFSVVASRPMLRVPRVFPSLKLRRKFYFLKQRRSFHTPWVTSGHYGCAERRHAQVSRKTLFCYPAPAFSANAASLLRLLFEISQVWWRLILLGRHQEPIRASEIVFSADHDVRVALAATCFRPPWTRIWVAPKYLVDAPRPRQSVIEHRDCVMKKVWIALVEKEALLEG